MAPVVKTDTPQPPKPTMQVLPSIGPSVYLDSTPRRNNFLDPSEGVDDNVGKILLMFWVPRFLARASSREHGVSFLAKAFSVPTEDMEAVTRDAFMNYQDGEKYSAMSMIGNWAFYRHTSAAEAPDSERNTLYINSMWALLQWGNRMAQLHYAAGSGMDLLQWIDLYTLCVLGNGEMPQGGPVANDPELLARVIEEAKAFNEAVRFLGGLDYSEFPHHLCQMPMRSAGVPLNPPEAS